MSQQTVGLFNSLGYPVMVLRRSTVYKGTSPLKFRVWVASGYTVRAICGPWWIALFNQQKSPASITPRIFSRPPLQKHSR